MNESVLSADVFLFYLYYSVNLCRLSFLRYMDIYAFLEKSYRFNINHLFLVSSAQWIIILVSDSMLASGMEWTTQRNQVC